MKNDLNKFIDTISYIRKWALIKFVNEDIDNDTLETIDYYLNKLVGISKNIISNENTK